MREIPLDGDNDGISACYVVEVAARVAAVEEGVKGRVCNGGEGIDEVSLGLYKFVLGFISSYWTLGVRIA
jgi:hypothetical protein